MSGPVKFNEKLQIVKPAGNHPYYFLERADHVQQAIRLVGLPSRQTALTHCDIQKTEKFCMSGPVKFDEKSQNCQTCWKSSILLPREVRSC